MTCKILQFIQFYPFGFLHNDSMVVSSQTGERTSKVMTENFFFYDNVVSTVYVCYMCCSYMHTNALSGSF